MARSDTTGRWRLTIGFIALAGVAAETGVVMLVYLDQAWAARVGGGADDAADLYDGRAWRARSSACGPR